MTGLDFFKWDYLSTTYALAPAICTGVTKPDIELEYLVEFIGMLALILQRF
jgi:hypothetical protein